MVNSSVTHRLLLICLLVGVSVVVIAIPIALTRDLFWLGESSCAAAAGVLLFACWRHHAWERFRWLGMLWLLVLAVVVNPACNLRARETRLAYDRVRTEISVRAVWQAMESYRYRYSGQEIASLYELVSDDPGLVQYLSNEDGVRRRLRTAAERHQRSDFDQLVSEGKTSVILTQDAGRICVQSRPIGDGEIALSCEDGTIAWRMPGANNGDTDTKATK